LKTPSGKKTREREETEMVQAVRTTRVEESIYSFIGDAGPVTPQDLKRFVGTDDFPAEVWLRAQANIGYLYRDPSGAYATSCPWPKSGF
jgi:hypothetical protein